MSSLVEQILAKYRATPGADLDLRKYQLAEADWADLTRRVDEFRSVESFRLTSSSTLRDGVAFALRLPSLSRAHFSLFTDADVKLAVEQLPQLTSLSLREGEHVTNVGLGEIAGRLSKLVKLDLTGCAKVTDAGIRALSEALPGLTYLDLSRCEQVTDAGVRAVAERMTKLALLNLNGCDQVTDIGILSVAERLRDLTSLHIGNCVKVTATGIRAVAERFPDLTSLDFGWCSQVTDADVLVVAERLTKLTLLGLAGCVKITDGSLEAVARRLPRLASLDLAGCANVSDAGIEAVANHLTGLTYLNLSGCERVTDTGVRAVAKQLSKLAYLNLGWCGELTDAAVEAVAARLSGLTYLKLSGCARVTDSGVRAVANSLYALAQLNLSGCEQVTDAGIQAVAERLNGLTHLTLTGCEQVTEHGLRQLAEAHLRGRLAALRSLQIEETKSELSEEVIASQSPEVIFRAILATNASPLREAKLLLVGDGEVGKSHLKERLDGAPHAFDARRKSTHGIDFKLWEATDDRPRTRLWDFGGQPHLHGSHRFFLGADHAAYVLVLDATRTAADNHLNYWLRFIAHYGKSARAGESTPVVIVLNKCDVLALANSAEFFSRWNYAETVRRNFADLEAGIKLAEAEDWHGANVVCFPISGLGTFPRAPSDYQHDTWLGTLPKDIAVPKVLYDQIQEQHSRALAEVNAAITCALSHVPSPRVGYPPEFHRLKKYLETKLADETPPEKPVPWVNTHNEEWNTDVVKGFGLPDEDIEIWLKTLRSLGIIHWVGDFDAVERDEYPTIRHRLFNPHWVKGPVYEVVNPRVRNHASGRVTPRILQWQLANYSSDERESVMELMLACKVAFKVRDKLTGEFKPDRLIPDLLEARVKPDDRRAEGALRWRFDVPFLSDRVLLRYIGDHYEDIIDHQVDCWRNRVEFPWPGNGTCLVKVTSDLEGSARENPFLRVEVTGGDRREREFVAGQVRLELARILRSEGLLAPLRDLETVDENVPETNDQWLRQLIRESRHGDWVDEETARSRHQLRTGRQTQPSPETFRDYRKPSAARLSLGDGSAGVDKNGYVWRYQDGGFSYLHPTLEIPVTPPIPHS